MCALVAACPAPAIAATPPAGLGINGQALMWLPPSSWQTHMSEMQRAGIHLVRFDATWASIEPSPPDGGHHAYRWGFTDVLVAALAAHHLRWLPMAGYSAPWAVPRSPLFPPDEDSPPSDPSEYAAFAGALARRYGPHGTFWRANPSFPQMPVTAIEIWNEENGGFFWHPAPDPARYGQLYEAARAAIHAASPSVEAIVGGLGSPGEGFLEQLYLALAGRRSMFDAVAVHPYAASAAAVGVEVARIRSILDAHRDVNVPIDVTEFGWSTSGFPLQRHASDAQRAAMLAQATALLARSDCGVGRILPYTWSTPQTNRANAEDWYGIVSPNGAPTLSEIAFAQELARLERGANAQSTVSLCHRTLALTLSHFVETGTHNSSRPASMRLVCVRATVTSAGSPVRGAFVTFSLDARGLRPARSAATSNSSGVAGTCLTLPRRDSGRADASATSPDFLGTATATLEILAG